MIRLRSLLAVLAAVGLAAAGAPSPTAPPLLLTDDYPIEVSVAFHKGLLHWLDSLAGLVGGGYTGGKTILSHRREYLERVGPLTPEDSAMLQRFRDARIAFARAASDATRDDLTLAFFESSDLSAARAHAQRLVEPDVARDLGATLDHFAPRYRQVWNDGTVPREFLRGVAADRRRREVAAFLVRVARFFDVPAKGEPTPQLVLVPVREGHGTHAQAIGRSLLVEIRPGEALADEIAPIVHENVHFLFQRIPAARREALGAAASASGPAGASSWLLLKEALPTAIGQGVAAQRFASKTWSSRDPWYHVESIDRYAKRIFPIVKRALADGSRLDEAFVSRLARARAESTATPRSP